MPPPPIITTVIPVYNGEQYIHETLASLARQTRRPDRIVVVDDGSTDRTQEIVEGFHDLRCEWAPNAKNLGLFQNHNSAIRFAAETQFLHILHANDLVSPEFFERLVPLIESKPGFAMAYSGHIFIREDGTETVQKGGINGDTPRKLTLKEFLALQSQLQAIQLHSAVLKTDYRPLPVKFRTDLPQLGDVIFHAEFASHCGEIWATPRVMCQVRIHSDSASTKNLKNVNAWVRDEWKAMLLVHSMMRERAFTGLFSEQKLQLLFAARSRVKMKMVKPLSSEYAEEIARLAKDQIGEAKWLAAIVIVALRDWLFPKADAAHERIIKSEGRGDRS